MCGVGKNTDVPVHKENPPSFAFDTRGFKGGRMVQVKVRSLGRLSSVLHQADSFPHKSKGRPRLYASLALGRESSTVALRRRASPPALSVTSSPSPFPTEQAQRPQGRSGHGTRHHPTLSWRPSAVLLRQPPVRSRGPSSFRWRSRSSIATPGLPIPLFACVPDQGTGRQEQDAQLLSGVHDLPFDGRREGSEGEGEEGT